jgi:hypothetical protein
MLKRWAEVYGRGAVAHGENNWQKACTESDLRGFERSAFHHFMMWLNGENPEEDHAAAIFFNVAGAEHVKAKLSRKGEVSNAPSSDVPATPISDTYCNPTSHPIR